MIVDCIKNAHLYYGIHPSFKKAFEALMKIDDDTPNDRITVQDNDIFINLSEYVNKSREECSFEAHKKYIDIQYVLSGEEIIDASNSHCLKIKEDRLSTDDIAFYENTSKYSSCYLQKGVFVILFPDEAHRPLVSPNEKGVKTRKAVAKIKF